MIVSLAKKYINNNFLKFLVVGILSTVINYLIFYVLYNVLGIYYLLSAIIGYLTGMVFGFYLNKSWTFSSTTKFSWHEVSKYAGIYMFSLALSSMLLYVLKEHFLLAPEIGNLFGIPLSTLSNFVGVRLFVFQKSKK